jgi:phasin family protein
MTKSARRKAAAETRGTRRNIARKSGVATTHRKARKTAPKIAAERARGPYRKTAARFEEFAYDGQMPESMRALAENSVAQTRELYARSFEAVLEGWESFLVAAGQGSVALNRKAIDIARRNINAGFGLAQRLAGAKNLAEAMELQATYWRKQLGELSSQAGEMRTLSTKVTADVAAPIKAQVTRGMRGVQKAT